MAAASAGCAFQYSLPDGNQHLLFVFRLPGAEQERVIYPVGLQPERLYTVEGFEGEFFQRRSGPGLLSGGLLFNSLEEEDSALLRIY
jgi:alpha-galactosidase